MSHFKNMIGLAFAGLMAVGVAHANPVEIEVWHSLSPTNKSEFEKITRQYNNDQQEVRVKLKAFASQQALQAEAAKIVGNPQAKRPELVQVDDNHSPEFIAQRKNIMPLYELLKQYPISDLKWFLPQSTGFVRDPKGNILAFPYMSEIPVMFINTDGYKKSGLDPKKPGHTWIDLQADLLALRDKGNYDCPYAVSNQVNVHLENLAPVNRSQFAIPNNGLDGPKNVTLNFDALYMRHLSLMVSWKRSDLLMANANDNKPDELFAQGKCAVLMTGSGSLGHFTSTRGLNFAVAPLPYYAQVTQKPGAPFVSGSAFWVVAGHTPAQNKATASFLGFLAKPVIASKWQQATGFLPLTDAAYRAADVSFFNRIQGAKELVELMRQDHGKDQRGFRLNNYHRVENILNTQFEAAISGKVPPVAALNNAIDQSKPLLSGGAPSTPTKAPAKK